MRLKPWTRCLPLLLLAGCAGSPGHAAGGNPAPAGAPIPAVQKTLTGRVPGERGGYRSLIKVTDAERSMPVGSRAALIRLDGIGVLFVSCARHPHASFVLTKFAAGEGPPARRCDLLAQATVVTHGPFYRYAHSG